ncbi:hypothetical protein DXV76_04120 [Rhodobacteraceae bacterium CCMM004]|nr:hypothetical protein DXV76_04120 [Rhodobacteraceae bacterium CCMM004]
MDLMFDHAIERFDILDYSGLRLLAEDLFEFDVDFVCRPQMRPGVRARAEAQAIQLF